VSKSVNGSDNLVPNIDPTTRRYKRAWIFKNPMGFMCSKCYFLGLKKT